MPNSPAGFYVSQVWYLKSDAPMVESDSEEMLGVEPGIGSRIEPGAASPMLSSEVELNEVGPHEIGGSKLVVVDSLEEPSANAEDTENAKVNK
ncbi:hypothetical protein BGX26_007196, partial [Mortierella sp. AD094]